MSVMVNVADDRRSYSNASNDASKPRAVVSIGGVKVTPKAFTVTRNAHGASDTASCVLPIANGPDWSRVLQPAVNQSVICAIYAGFGGSGFDISSLSTRFYGILDEYDPKASTNEVRFSFRSLAALLIAQKITTQTSANQTTTDFASRAAASVGLRTNIQLPPGQKPATLQQVFASDLLYGIHNLRKWDILVRSAMVDGVDLWVANDVLNYISADLVDRSYRTVQYGRDLIDFEGKHAPQFNKNIKVQIRTYNPRTTISHVSYVTTDANGNAVTSSKTRNARSVQLIGTGGSVQQATTVNDLTGAVSQSTRTSVTSGGAFTSGATSIPNQTSAEVYNYYIPNLAPQDVDNRALQIWQQLSEHEYSGTFSFAITPEFLLFADITTLFSLQNYTYANFNCTPDNPSYYPRKMIETMEVSQSAKGDSAGWKAEFECVNHSLPAGEV